MAALILIAARGYVKSKHDTTSGAASSPSMNGWRDFRWGMSQAEVDEVIRLKSFGVVVRKNNDKGEPVIHLAPVSVGDFSLNPTLHFGLRGLDFLFLFCPEDKATITAYEELKAYLTQEIGLPPTPDDGAAVSGVAFRVRGAVWSFPKTTVEIRFAGSIENPGNALFISYREPTSIQPATVASAPPPQLITLTFSGVGQQATSPADFEKALYVFRLNHTGQRNFAVWVMDAAGNKVELLVNTVGPFSGSKAVQIPAKGRYLLDVTADGDWSITAGAP